MDKDTRIHKAHDLTDVIFTDHNNQITLSNKKQMIGFREYLKCNKYEFKKIIQETINLGYAELRSDDENIYLSLTEFGIEVAIEAGEHAITAGEHDLMVRRYKMKKICKAIALTKEYWLQDLWISN